MVEEIQLSAPKLPQKDDDVLAETALTSARRLGTNRKERAHAWYALSRRREKIKRRLRELMTDYAIKTSRKPQFCKTKTSQSNMFHQRKEWSFSYRRRETRRHIRSFRQRFQWYWIRIGFGSWLVGKKTLDVRGPGYVTKFRCFNFTRSCFEIYQVTNIGYRRYCYWNATCLWR